MSGAPVWQALDQAALDRAYDQSQWAANMAEVMARYVSGSERTRQRLGPPQRLAYGSGARESLDLHGSPGQEAPALFFVHGGAWRSGAAHDYAFVVEPFVRAGARVVIPDFDAVQDCGGDLHRLADQVQRALAWAMAHARELGIEAQRVHLCGHSSGAHLAAVVASRWRPDQGPALASLLCCSGLYELEPVRRSSRSRYVNLDDAGVQALSPARHAAQLRGPVLMAVGSQESPQFIWQSQHWQTALAQAGVGSSGLLLPGQNQFELLEGLAHERSLLARLQLRRMGLDQPGGDDRPISPP
jgi:arylformamidase